MSGPAGSELPCAPVEADDFCPPWSSTSPTLLHSSRHSRARTHRVHSGSSDTHERIASQSTREKALSTKQRCHRNCRPGRPTCDQCGQLACFARFTCARRRQP